MHHYECVLRSAKRRHQSPKWAILSHVSCFFQGEGHNENEMKHGKPPSGCRTVTAFQRLLHETGCVNNTTFRRLCICVMYTQVPLSLNINCWYCPKLLMLCNWECNRRSGWKQRQPFVS